LEDPATSPIGSHILPKVACSFEKVVAQMIASHEKGEQDHSELMRTLDPKQRKALHYSRNMMWLCQTTGRLFGFNPEQTPHCVKMDRVNSRNCRLL
jgi:hypothetical protein